MNQILDKAKVPKGGFTYVDPDSGVVLQSPYFHVVRNMAKSHRQANNYPIGLNWEEDFEDNLCRHASPGVCVEFIPPTELEKASMLVRALVKWAMAGFPVRSKEDAARVIGICRSCEFYGGERGLLKVVCRRCGCSGKKTFLSTEHCPLPDPKW